MDGIPLGFVDGTEFELPFRAAGFGDGLKLLNDFILFLLILFWLFAHNWVTSGLAARSSYHPISYNHISGLAS
jgi:hypothetical protein